MKTIKRHPLIKEDIEWGYEKAIKYIEDTAESAKKHFNSLRRLRLESIGGLCIATGLNLVQDYKFYITRILRGYKGEFLPKANHGKATEVMVDENTTVLHTYTKDEFINRAYWIDAYCIHLIARENTDWLYAIPLKCLDKPTTSNLAPRFVRDLFQYLYFQDNTEKEKAFNKVENMLQSEADELRPRPNGRQTEYLFLRRYWHLVHQAIAENNQEEFTDYLYKATEDHKTYWSQNRGLNRGELPLKEQKEGFFALVLTGFCAKAYDAGLKIEVESEYLDVALYSGSFKNE